MNNVKKQDLTNYKDVKLPAIEELPMVFRGEAVVLYLNCFDHSATVGNLFENGTSLTLLILIYVFFRE